MSDPGWPAGTPPVGYTILERPVGVPALPADDIDAATGELLSIDVPVHPVDAAVGFLSRCRRGSGPAPVRSWCSGRWLGFSCAPRLPWALSQVILVPGVPLLALLMSAS